ncbi:MAG: S53 family peptidase [Candidatus Aminicenantes bacterium]|jgi:kumamolisin
MTQSKKVSIEGSEAPPVPGSRKVGIPDPNEQIEVIVHLRYHPESKGLPSMEELVARPSHERKHLTHEEFLTTYGTSPDDIARVKKFADEHNLDVNEEDLEPAHRLVTLTGTIKDFSSAFSVEFINYQHPEYNTIFRTYKGAVKIPENLEYIVDSVFGLENIPAFRPHIDIHRHEPEEPLYYSLKGKFYPNQIADLYHFPKDLTGEGESIAIIALDGGYHPKYLQEYFATLKKKFNIHIDMNNITDVSVAGAQNNPYMGPVTNMKEFAKYAPTAETYVDIEVACAVANGAKIVVYFAPNTHKGFLQALKHAVHDKKHNNSVISISWGWPEPILPPHRNGAKRGLPINMKAVNQTLHEAVAAKKITVCVASGDNGSSDYPFSGTDGLAHVDFPASSPWALACGGTRLFIKDNEISKEFVWKNLIDYLKIGGCEFYYVTISSGGGVSEFFDCPAYQRGNGVIQKSANPGHRTGRGVPDIAGNADRRSGYIVRINKETTITGGTSLVAPLYAALVARINQKLNHRVHFLNHSLYQIGKSEAANDVFNDIINQGDNVTRCKCAQKEGYKEISSRGYYPQAGKRWNACTGWGSVNGKNLLKALQKQK